MHEFLDVLLEKKLRFIESMKGAKFDLVETGGGAASSTVISPKLHEEFCLPYDRKIHDALHDLGFKVTYHTCGGTLGIEELIVANGCDASETLAPPSVGGNQEPWEFARKIDGRIALIGGVDQFNVVTDGTPEQIRADGPQAVRDGRRRRRLHLLAERPLLRDAAREAASLRRRGARVRLLSFRCGRVGKS